MVTVQCWICGDDIELPSTNWKYYGRWRCKKCGGTNIRERRKSVTKKKKRRGCLFHDWKVVEAKFVPSRVDKRLRVFRQVQVCAKCGKEKVTHGVGDD